LRNPAALLPNSIQPDKIGAVKLQKMKLVGEPEKQRAIDSEEPDDPVFAQVQCDLLIKSIGYKSL